MRNRKASAATAATEDLNVRVTEAANALGIPNPMRKAAYELALGHDYEAAAKRAGVTPDVVREWAFDLRFIAAIGFLVIGWADNAD